MKNKVSYAYIASFLILLILPTIVFGLFGQYFDQTNYEKREAAERPKFSLSTISSFPAAYESYYNDRIPFRNQLIELKSLSDYYLFKQSPSKSVVLGSDGWLFYETNKEQQNPINDYLGVTEMTEEELKRCADNLMGINDSLKQKGKEFVLMIAPNKECIYGSKYMPSKYEVKRENTQSDILVDYLKKNTDINVVYPKDEIFKAINQLPQYDLYYKTDTHWNGLGAFVGFKELLKAIDVELPSLDNLQISKVDGYAGDLTGMMGLSKYMDYDSHYAVSGFPVGEGAKLVKNEDSRDNYLVYTNTGMDERRICVLRDSYTTAMTDYIASQFNEAHLIHRLYYKPEMLDAVNPDVVILQIVERDVIVLLDFVL